jgi:hypothetical protein
VKGKKQEIKDKPPSFLASQHFSIPFSGSVMPEPVRNSIRCQPPKAEGPEYFLTGHTVHLEKSNCKYDISRICLKEGKGSERGGRQKE